MLRRILSTTARLAASVAAAALTTLAAAPAAAVPNDAASFPNVPLVTHEGKAVKFADDFLKGRKVLVNFMFATCEQACPLDTAKMKQIQQLLGERVGKDIVMVSVTLDPEHDTPEVLADYAKRYGIGPGWHFVTGKRPDIDRLRDKFGERTAKENHANTVRAGDVDRGAWMRLPLATDAVHIANEVINTFYPGWSFGKTLPSIEQAASTEIWGKGQLIFNNRCSACHTFGKGDLIGPDLRGVLQRREAAWVLRYLAEPEKVRASGDAISKGLGSYYKVPMPNLSLTRQDMEELMEYLARQGMSAPVAAAAVPAPQPAPVAPPVPAAGGHDHSHHHHH